MGLDAMVFKSIHALEKRFGRDLFDLDHTTGEASLKLNSDKSIPSNEFVAIEKRIGNLSEVAHLRQVIDQIFPNNDTVLQTTILRSATHSGDVIQAEEQMRLKNEMSIVKEAHINGLCPFIDAIESLLLAAQREANPIVFV